MAAKNTTPQRLVVGPWSHVGMRGDATYTLDVDFGEDSTWGVQRYFAEQLAFFDRWLKEDGAAPADEAPVRIFVMGGGSGRKTAARQARPRRPLARRARVAARARRRRPSTCTPTARSRSRRLRARRSRGATSTTPTIRCRRSAATTARSASCRRTARGWSRRGARFLNPALRLRNIMTPGPADQKETAEFFAAREPTRGCRSAPTCSSTRPSRSRSRSRSPGRGGSSCASRRAPSTPTSPRSSWTSIRRTRTIRRATTCSSTTRSSAAATARASSARC